MSGNPCPATPAFSLSGSAAVTGSLVYDNVANTVSFTLSNIVPASFGGPLLAPGLFSAAGIPVTSIPLGGGQYQIVQIGPATATAPLAFPPFVTTANTPVVSGLTCVVNTGADQCGFSLGAGGWTLNDGALPPNPSTDYNVFMTFNVNVPEPTPLALLGMGTAALILAGRRGA